MNIQDQKDYLSYLQDEYNSQAFIENESIKEFNRQSIKKDMDNIKKLINEDN